MELQGLVRPEAHGILFLYKDGWWSLHSATVKKESRFVQLSWICTMEERGEG